MRAGSIMLAAIVAASTLSAPVAEAQRPRIGIGIVAGTVLGSQLAEHEFSAALDGRGERLVQAVDLRETGIIGLEAELYLTDHIALRGHAARGSGRLRAEAYRDEVGDEQGAEFSGDLGRVGLNAFDAGVSIWPWAPRSVGFAPFITVGYGIVNYDFSPAEGDAVDFFLADDERRRNAILVGGGADMRLWQSISLRFEAVNHMSDPPLGTDDFDLGTVDGGLGGRVNNVRLVLGAHVYLPWDGQFAARN